MTVYNEKKETRELDSVIAEGGEGVVYSVKNTPNAVVKVYKNLSEVKEKYLSEKIKAQIEMKNLIALENLAWPKMEVYDHKMRWIGFAMRKVEGITLSKIAHPILYKKYFPELNRSHITDLMLSIIKVIDALHKQNVFIGDINPNNILVNKNTNKASIIDTDSFQIVTGNRKYPCLVGRPEMTPLEHHGKDYSQIDRNAASDLFSFAIICFQSFMMGRYPYDNIGGESAVENLKKGHFPYGNGGVAPGRNGAIPAGHWYSVWSHLTFKMKTNFIKTFKQGVFNPKERTSLSEWESCLKDYRYAIDQGFSENELNPGYAKENISVNGVSDKRNKKEKVKKNKK